MVKETHETRRFAGAVNTTNPYFGVSRILGKRERKREAGTGTTDGKCLKKDIMSIY